MKLDEDFIEIREYLYDNEGASVEEVAEATGVSRKSIMYLLKEERLLVSESSAGSGILRCEACRKPINTGRMCAGCKQEIAKTMQDSISAVKAPLPKRLAKEPEEESLKSGAAKLQLK